MNVAEALRAAMALIEDESRWCRRWVACNSDGELTHYSWPDAVQWCAVGALCHVCPEPGSDTYSAARSLLPRDLMAINDVHGHAAVMECYREAIRRAEAQS